MIEKRIAGVLLSGAAFLLVEVRFEHREVLGETWRGWIPLTCAALLLAAGVPAWLAWTGRTRKILSALFALAAAVGLLGAWFHSDGHPLKAFGRVASAWMPKPGQDGGETPGTPPRPLAAPGVGGRGGRAPGGFHARIPVLRHVSRRESAQLAARDRAQHLLVLHRSARRAGGSLRRRARLRRGAPSAAHARARGAAPARRSGKAHPGGSRGAAARVPGGVRPPRAGRDVLQGDRGRHGSAHRHRDVAAVPRAPRVAGTARRCGKKGQRVMMTCAEASPLVELELD